MKNKYAKKKKSAASGVTTTLNYDPISQLPVATYFGASVQVSSTLEAEFEQDYAQDNDYTWKNLVAFWLKKFKRWIVFGIICLAIFLLAFFIYTNV